MNSLMKRILTKSLISALLLVPSGLLATTVKLSFATDAPRSVWVLAKLPDKLPENGREFTVKEFEIEVPDEFLSGIVLVGETDTGNYATKRCQEIINKGIWRVQQADYVVGRVSVNVAKDSQPADGVMVTLTRGKYEKSTLSVEGDADFYFVSFGDAEVTATYSNGKEQITTPPKPMRITFNREDVVPTEVIGLPADAQLATKPATNQQKEAPKQAEPTQGWLSVINLFYYLIALAIAGAAVWYLFKLAKQNDTKIVEQLRNMGVDPLSPADGGDAQTQANTSAQPTEAEPLVPAGHCLFCGEKFDANGLCACSRRSSNVHAASPTTAVAAVPLVGNVGGARLISDSGLEIAIPEGTSVIGREGDLVIPDATVSRRHAEISNSSGQLLLKDLGSANGTFVNGVKVEQSKELAHGDSVQFGGFKMRVSNS